MNRAFSPPARGERCGKFSGLLRNHEVCLKISWFNLLTVPGLTAFRVIASVTFLAPRMCMRAWRVSIPSSPCEICDAPADHNRCQAGWLTEEEPARLQYWKSSPAVANQMPGQLRT